ncbi:MAG: right-handed parallel beta-helix repeat-containing protein [Cytophagaceae bacterium]
MRSFFTYMTMIFLGVCSVGYSQQIPTGDCECDYVIPKTVLAIDADTLNINPGDRICIMGGERRFLALRNFRGSRQDPLLFINCEGQVVVRNSDWHYGIRIDNSQYFRFSGTGDPEYEYGFYIAEASSPGIIGFTIGRMSSDMEIDHVRISNTGFAGLMIKTDPDCEGSPNRGNFVQRNTVVHNMHVHDTNGEGIYIGFPHYTGMIRECNGDSIRVFPHDLKGVKIYNNWVENTAREGIQVGCAVEDCEIYDNVIVNFGLRNENWQNSGLHLSTGTTGIVRHNTIKHGRGPGVWLNGFGDNYFYNNVIFDVGKEGFLCHDSLVREGTGYHILNNSIVSVGEDGFRLFNNHLSDGHQMINNIISGTGGTYYRVDNEAAFFQAHNYFNPEPRRVYFKNVNIGDLRLHRFSPAIDAGMDLSEFGVVNDILYEPRPMGKAYDCGAHESEYERYSIDFTIYPNPSIDHAIISFINYEDGYVGLRIYDELGRLMRVLIDGHMEAGIYNIDHISGDLAAAVYFCELRRQDEKMVKRMVIVK